MSTFVLISSHFGLNLLLLILRLLLFLLFFLSTLDKLTCLRIICRWYYGTLKVLHFMFRSLSVLVVKWIVYVSTLVRTTSKYHVVRLQFVRVKLFLFLHDWRGLWCCCLKSKSFILAYIDYIAFFLFKGIFLFQPTFFICYDFCFVEWFIANILVTPKVICNFYFLLLVLLGWVLLNDLLGCLLWNFRQSWLLVLGRCLI